MNQSEELSRSLTPANIDNSAMPLSQQLAVRTDTLQVVRQMNRQFQKNNSRELLAYDAMHKVANISLLEAELAMQNPHATERLAYIANYFTYLCAQDLL